MAEPGLLALKAGAPLFLWRLLMVMGPLVIMADAKFNYAQQPYAYYPLSESNASRVTGLVDGSTYYMRFLHVEPDYVLVGAKNMLYNISTVTMVVQAIYQWTPSEKHVQDCQKRIEYYQDCESYIRSVQKESDANLTVCASSAKSPSCKTLSYKGPGWELEGSVYEVSQVAFAPLFPLEELVIHKTAEEIVYAATHFYPAVDQPAHSLIRDGYIQADGSQVQPLSSAQTESAINSDNQVGMRPQFIKIFESRDHVYLLFTEPAKELDSIQKAIYSRVARVCKNDRGNDNMVLMTFFKARLLCGLPEMVPQGSNRHNSTKGHYSYYFDHLVSASELHTDPASGEQMVIAAFNSPSNSVGGSAICVYKLSDMEEVFDTSATVNQNGYVTRQIRGRPPAQCPANTDTLTADQEEDSRHPLLRNPVKSINSDTLFIQAGSNYKMTQMVVDWKVKGPDGINRTVIFVSTDDGKLLKLVNFKKEGDGEPRYHLVEEREIFPGQAIREMRLITDSSHKKHLLLSTYTSIKRVAVEKCHRYETCFRCAALRDPYCSWSSSHDSCVSTSHSARDKIQSVETGKLEECDAYTTAAPKAEVEDVTLDDSIIKGTGKTSKQREGEGNNTVYIALLVFLPILTLAGGIVIGIAYHRYRSQRTDTSHLEDALNAKKKKVDRSDSDAYQDLPPSLKTPQIEYKRNNLVKTDPVVSDPYEPLPHVAESESTLARTKQTYL